MPRFKKLGADAVQEAAMGHNSQTDSNLREYVAKIAKKMNSIDGIKGEIKDLLNEAKDEGFLKTSIRQAIKTLRLTEEQMQARKEIDAETVRITELCADLPLFSGQDAREAA